MAIGVMNHKTTAVRIIPVPGRDVGDIVEYGGLLGSAPSCCQPILVCGFYRARRTHPRPYSLIAQLTN
jgi:hypothetical protein